MPSSIPERKIWLRTVLALATLACWAAYAPPSRAADAAGDALEQRFRQPQDTDKPWAYWWWLKGNVSEASIRRDLEEMKRKGFAGLLLFYARGSCRTLKGRATAFSGDLTAPTSIS